MADRKHDDVDNATREDHLDVYSNRSELHLNEVSHVYYEGMQTAETQQRYNDISNKLDNNYLEQMWNSLGNADLSDLSEHNKKLIESLVNGMTSDRGRGLVEVAFLQMAIKAISPNQSIRLHKGAPQPRQGSFSWKDGISMRTLDAAFITPFMREHELLNLNKDGAFMTRTLAENYPYSKLYKAEMRGPFSEWMNIVDALEDMSMPAYPALCYLTIQLKNHSNSFKTMAKEVISKASRHKGESFGDIKGLLMKFVNSSGYPARAFEVVIHGFMQAKDKHKLLGNLMLEPLSQMRLSNKKKGNIGDIELKCGEAIVEAWDAKYEKPYLRDELDELCDKLSFSSAIKVAGFIVDREVDRRRDIDERIDKIEDETDVEIYIYSFDDWISHETEGLNEAQLNQIGFDWLIAVTKSFGQQNREIAPIDEPCDQWIDELNKIL